MKDSRYQENMKKIAAMLSANPSLTHIYVTRIGVDGATIDIPVHHAEMTLKNNPLWEVVGSNKQMDDEIEKLFDDVENDPTDETPSFSYNKDVVTPVVPPKPSEVAQEEKVEDALEDIKEEENADQNTQETSGQEGSEEKADEPKEAPAPKKRARKTAARKAATRTSAKKK